MSSITVVLDANVLFPASLRDTLIRAGQRDLYQMQWTLEILEEVRRNLVKAKRVEPTKAQHLINTLITVFPRAIVTEDYQALIPLMRNDVKDQHVLAAAVACKAQIIVTSNLHAHLPHGQLVR
jgi:predicted nucleic acid-binding protein